MKCEDKNIEVQDGSKIETYFRLKGLGLQKIKKSVSKTPDYYIYLGSQLMAYCELKSIILDDWEGGTKPDPTYNTIQNKIHESAKQLSRINANHVCPNILAIVNHNQLRDSRDLFTVLKGTFLSEKGEVPFDNRYLIRLIKKGDLSIIDIVFWFENGSYNPQATFVNKASIVQEEINKIFSLLVDCR